MDFVDDESVFVIKGEAWMDEECQVMRHNPLTPDFVYRYDIAVFLLTLEDAVDTSNFIFNVHDNEYPEHPYRGSESGDGRGMMLYLANSMNTVYARRRVRPSQGMSNTIPQYLAKQRQALFMKEELLCNLRGLQSAWEPFGMQRMALGSGASK